MGDFDGKDRFGRRIFFPQETWDHAIDRQHFAPVKGAWATVMEAFASSTVVLDNDEPPDRTEGPVRLANERYISFIQEWDQFLIVPVIVHQVTPFSRPGAASIPAPVRVAWTAHLDVSVPTDGEVLWKWPPDPE